jgi:hypothetical protein
MDVIVFVLAGLPDLDGGSMEAGVFRVDAVDEQTAATNVAGQLNQGAVDMYTVAVDKLTLRKATPAAITWTVT